MNEAETAVYPRKQAGYHVGGPMFDTSGKVIQAHGGGLLYENGVYYWFGENKEYTLGDGKIWTYGINCYSSTDLINWKNEGLIIPPDTENPHSSLHPSKPLDRPHILHCRKTGKYVCWLKLSENDAYFVVLTADAITGPYTIVRDHIHPYGVRVGDFDLWQDEAGNGYIFFEHDHNGIFAATLTDDFLDITEPHTDMFTGLKPPYTREGVTHFVHNGKHYLLTSGMSGYIPNPSEVAVSDVPLGPYRVLGNPHRNDPSGASCNSQISAILQHPQNPELYLTLADRWIPSLVMTADIWDKLCVGFRALEKHRWLFHLREIALMGKMPWQCNKINTSLAEYVWLPLHFEGDMPVIDCTSNENEVHHECNSLKN